MLNRTILLFALGCLCIPGFGQVKLHGEVAHSGKPIDQVTIQVYEAGKLQRTIAASKKGKYDMEFPMGHHYLLVFHRPYMIPVRIHVNTEIPSSPAVGAMYDVPLNMEMFYRYKALDAGAYDEPIGEVSAEGEGENTFVFHPDEAQITAIKNVNKISSRFEAEGAEPLDEPEETRQQERTAPVKDSRPASPATGNPENADGTDEAKTAPVTPGEKELRMDRQATRYDQMEQAKEEHSAQARDMQMKSQAVQTDRDDIQDNYIVESKKTRSEALTAQEQEEQNMLDAKARKQERLAGEAKYAARLKESSPRAPRTEVYGISRRTESGWFYSEEVLRVYECGEKNEYKHVTYDWLLFKADYYYLNDSEIPQEEYEVAKNLFK